MIIDLHMHSHYSPDGRYSIPKLLDLFSEGDIAGLTDHETIGGWEEFEKEAENRGIKPILGVEWFTKDNHIVSYFLDNSPIAFLDFMKSRRKVEYECMIKIYQKFRKIYPKIPNYNALIESIPHPENILGVTALAKAIEEASGNTFKDSVLAIRKKRGILPLDKQQQVFSEGEIIKMIQDWGGMSFLAHPFKNPIEKGGRTQVKDVEERIIKLSKLGVNGVELSADGNSETEWEYLLSIIHNLGLLVSIGSDYHYPGKGKCPAELNKIDKSIFDEVLKWVKE